MRGESGAADGKMRSLAAEQGGVVTRAQALDCGLTGSHVAHCLSSNRWQRLHRGVYTTFNGPVPRLSALWAAVLFAGPGAMLSHATAAELWNLTERVSPLIHLTIPHTRAPARSEGLTIHRSRYATTSRHPSRQPPVTRVEDTVVDLTQIADRLDEAIAWLARAIGGRFTTAAKLLVSFESRPKLRWRNELYAALVDVGDGSHSVLELMFLRDVERAHDLPRSVRQVRRATGQYDDVRYPEYGVRVELDGRAAHPQHLRWRDMHRDNLAALEDDHVLRYGYVDVAAHPCQVAAQVAPHPAQERLAWANEPMWPR